jgi:hypothetical protein
MSVYPMRVSSMRKRIHGAGGARVLLSRDTHGPLITPAFIPPTPQARKKHAEEHEASYSPDGINRMIRWAVRRLAAGMPELTADDRRLLT